jgi:hypothetical protein
MMEKLAHAGEGGGCTPNPLHYSYHHVQSCSVRSSGVGKYTYPVSSLPIYVLCEPTCRGLVCLAVQAKEGA